MTQARHKVVVVKAESFGNGEEVHSMAAQGWELVSLSQAPVLSMVAVFRRTGD